MPLPRLKDCCFDEQHDCRERKAIGQNAGELTANEAPSGTRIFAPPLESSSGEKLDQAIVQTRGHSIAVELDFVDPLRPGWRLWDRI
jgi:hypothetical protein